METIQHAETAAEAVNGALERAGAHAVHHADVVQLSDEADRDIAVHAIQEAFTPEQLRARPVMLWHGADEILVGPHAAISVTELVPSTRSLDVRVRPQHALEPSRVVVSWLDGPTREAVVDRLAGLPATGLDIHLLREELGSLLADVIDAAFVARGELTMIAAHPILDRVAAVRDGRDTYYCLLDLSAELLLHIKRRRRREYIGIMAAVGRLEDQDAVDAVLDDLGTRMVGGQFFPVRAIDDEATLAALFVVLALTARAVGPAVRARARDEVVLP